MSSLSIDSKKNFCDFPPEVSTYDFNDIKSKVRDSFDSLRPVKPTWDQRIINKLDTLDTKLEKALPNFLFQTKIDQLFNHIKNEFRPLNKFNKWLDSNGQGEWYKKLAIFLCKLPIRVVRNVLKLLYTLAKAVCFTAVHPLKATLKLAKLLVKLAKELTKPETWTKLGFGLIGASLGHAAASNPISVFGMAIGGLMAVAGLSIGALKAALKAKDTSKGKAALDNLINQAIAIPEAMLTGLCIGFLIGAIQGTGPTATAPSRLLAMGASLQIA